MEKCEEKDLRNLKGRKRVVLTSGMKSAIAVVN